MHTFEFKQYYFSQRNRPVDGHISDHNVLVTLIR